jgi:hypothetical protein
VNLLILLLNSFLSGVRVCFGYFFSREWNWRFLIVD